MLLSANYDLDPSPSHSCATTSVIENEKEIDDDDEDEDLPSLDDLPLKYRSKKYAQYSLSPGINGILALDNGRDADDSQVATISNKAMRFGSTRGLFNSIE
jgi:hypothetical protein